VSPTTSLLCVALLAPGVPLPVPRAAPPAAESSAAPQAPEPALAPFPPASVARECRDFALARYRWLRARRDCFGRSLDAAVADQEYRHRCWDALADAAGAEGCDRQDPLGREALRRLRALLGEDDFRLGRMPEPAEWGQFSRID
jgi:hypothetical protein